MEALMVAERKLLMEEELRLARGDGLFVSGRARQDGPADLTIDLGADRAKSGDTPALRRDLAKNYSTKKSNKVTRRPERQNTEPKSEFCISVSQAT
jgi:hypothetical protein